MNQLLPGPSGFQGDFRCVAAIGCRLPADKVVKVTRRRGCGHVPIIGAANCPQCGAPTWMKEHNAAGAIEQDANGSMKLGDYPVLMVAVGTGHEQEPQYFCVLCYVESRPYAVEGPTADADKKLGEPRRCDRYPSIEEVKRFVLKLMKSELWQPHEFGLWSWLGVE